MTPTRRLLLPLCMAICFGQSAYAATITFIQDEGIVEDGETLVDHSGNTILYIGTQDAEIRERNKNNNYDEGTGSSNPEFTVDSSDPHGSGRDAHVLLRFDHIFGMEVGQIPLSATITSASLFIDIDDTGDDMSLYKMLSDWGTETGVTWKSMGGDGVTPGTEAVFLTEVDGGGDKVDIDVTDQLIDWIGSGGGNNFGWAFLPGGDNGVDFDASENSDWKDRPALTVSYEINGVGTGAGGADFVGVNGVPSPAPFWLLAPALASLGFLRRNRKAS